ncbi:hypothetical protein D3C73_567810 [compost metagenome]
MATFFFISQSVLKRFSKGLHALNLGGEFLPDSLRQCRFAESIPHRSQAPAHTGIPFGLCDGFLGLLLSLACLLFSNHGRLRLPGCSLPFFVGGGTDRLRFGFRSLNIILSRRFDLPRTFERRFQSLSLRLFTLPFRSREAAALGSKAR